MLAVSVIELSGIGIAVQVDAGIRDGTGPGPVQRWL